MIEPEQILKTDARGRVRYTPQRRALLLDEFQASGLSGCKFAALVGVKYQTFATWVKKRRQQNAADLPAKTNKPLRWVEAVMPAPPPNNSAGLKVRLSSGASVEVSDLHQVALAAALLRALERPATAC